MQLTNEVFLFQGECCSIIGELYPQRSGRKARQEIGKRLVMALLRLTLLIQEISLDRQKNNYRLQGLRGILEQNKLDLVLPYPLHNDSLKSFDLKAKRRNRWGEGYSTHITKKQKGSLQPM